MSWQQNQAGLPIIKLAVDYTFFYFIVITEITVFVQHSSVMCTIALTVDERVKFAITEDLGCIFIVHLFLLIQINTRVYLCLRIEIRIEECDRKKETNKVLRQ